MAELSAVTTTWPFDIIKHKEFGKHTLPTTPESNSQLTGTPNSLYREMAKSLVRKSAYTLCSNLQMKTKQNWRT